MCGITLDVRTAIFFRWRKQWSVLGGVLYPDDPKELVCYLLAYRSVKKPQEYENRLKELNVSDEVKDTLKKALDEFAQKKEVSIRPGKADEMLEKLTGEYHRSTGS